MTSCFLQNKAPGFYRGVLGNSSYFKVHLCAHPRSSGFYPRSCTLNRGASFSFTCVQLLPGSWLFCLKNDPQNHLFSPLPLRRALFFLPPLPHKPFPLGCSCCLPPSFLSEPLLLPKRGGARGGLRDAKTCWKQSGTYCPMFIVLRHLST